MFPLTKESIFTNNHNGQNYGGAGEIANVDLDGCARMQIPEDDSETDFFLEHCGSLNPTIIHTKNQKNLRHQTIIKIGHDDY